MSDHISDPGDIICKSPSRMYGRNVLKSTEEDFCVDLVKRALTIALSAMASVAVILVLTGMFIAPDLTELNSTQLTQLISQLS